MRSLHVLLPTLGSAGDVYPAVAVGLALQARGHQATILTNPYFRALIEQQGLGFLPVGTLEEAQQAFSYPHLWELRRGAQHVLRMMLPATEPVFRHIERQADSNTVVASSGLALGARIAQEKLGVPMASLHLQPSLIRSYIDQGKAGNVRLASWQPMWFKRGLFSLADALLFDRMLKPGLNAFRSQLGLGPVDHVFAHWLHSPQLVIGMFPEWFATPQADWPPQTRLVGFPLWDKAGAHSLPPEVDAYLGEGPPPIVFTPGSAGSTMQAYFRASVAAVSRLGLRAMLVTNHPQQLPASLPPGVRAFGYLPFSLLLPRVALMVYHGGIGTLAQTISAGLPHLVVPHAHDQFDNAWRIERLGLGRSLSIQRYHAGRVEQIIRSILNDRALQSRCRGFAAQMDANAALSRTCELIESLHAGVPHG